MKNYLFRLLKLLANELNPFKKPVYYADGTNATVDVPHGDTAGVFKPDELSKFPGARIIGGVVQASDMMSSSPIWRYPQQFPNPIQGTTVSYNRQTTGEIIDYDWQGVYGAGVGDFMSKIQDITVMLTTHKYYETRYNIDKVNALGGVLSVEFQNRVISDHSRNLARYLNANNYLTMIETASAAGRTVVVDYSLVDATLTNLIEKIEFFKDYVSEYMDIVMPGLQMIVLGVNKTIYKMILQHPYYDATVQNVSDLALAQLQERNVSLFYGIQLVELTDLPTWRNWQRIHKGATFERNRTLTAGTEISWVLGFGGFVFHYTGQKSIANLEVVPRTNMKTIRAMSDIWFGTGVVLPECIWMGYTTGITPLTDDASTMAGSQAIADLINLGIALPPLAQSASAETKRVIEGIKDRVEKAKEAKEKASKLSKPSNNSETVETEKAK